MWRGVGTEIRGGLQRSGRLARRSGVQPQREESPHLCHAHGIKNWYTDAQMLMDNPNVNAIYIATPPSAHSTYAIMAMRAGKPCYIEKPLAASYEDCVRINRVSEQTGVPCFVAYPISTKSRRLWPKEPSARCSQCRLDSPFRHATWTTT